MTVHDEKQSEWSKSAQLSSTQLKLLTAIYNEGATRPPGVDALQFRAKHEDERSNLDDLERRGFLLRANDYYTLPLMTIRVLSGTVQDADNLYYACGSVFNCLRETYKTSPRQALTSQTVAEIADLKIEIIRRVLPPLLNLGIAQSSSPSPDGSYSNIVLWEQILDHRSLDTLVAQRIKHSVPMLRPKGSGSLEQGFGILYSKPALEADIKLPCGELGMAVIFIDIDHFKKLNSDLTEKKADALILRPFQERLRAIVDQVGLAYRVGGEEFVVLLLNTSRLMAVALAETIRIEIEALQLFEEASNKSITVSVGVAHGVPPIDGDTLWQKANSAENFAKKSGRNCVAEMVGDVAARVEFAAVGLREPVKH